MATLLSLDCWAARFSNNSLSMNVQVTNTDKLPKTVACIIAIVNMLKKQSLVWVTVHTSFNASGI